MTGQIALLLRVFILLPLAGLAATLPFVTYDKAAGLLTIDLNAASLAIAALLYGLLSGGTFAWSRWVKGVGGKT
ncbi:hypothetical protein ACFSDD_13585 [Salipiger marinus]|uniref:hypothetical protein n=1 Tax=Salipiger marinus TaxID=555512 RepID=UPI001E2CEEB9|nr:hypothetical protein [Salipiger manganoxidans]MCD1616496.1 hypothetical protein [Salipiger manganoxidans]MEB3419014.1 hypothetical protein [Salipiger manganoxidans]